MKTLKSIFMMIATIILMTTFPTVAAAGEYAKDIQTLYVAYFNRPADPQGLATSEAIVAATTAGAGPGSDAANAALTGISNTFAASAEYKAAFAGLSDDQIVAKVYENLFGRTIEPAGLAYWSLSLARGLITIGQIARELSNGAQGTDADVLANKISAATAFTNALDSTEAYAGATANHAAKAWLANITNADSLAAAINPEALKATITSITSTAAPQSTTPAKEALNKILQDLDELTEDLKIEEEDNSTDYQEAKSRIDGQEGLEDTSTPSILYRRVQELKITLSEATTDEKRKEVADAIIALQAKTQVWIANFGGNWGPGTGSDLIVLQGRDNLNAINARIREGIQNTIRGLAVTCTSAYNPITHLTVTTCN